MHAYWILFEYSFSDKVQLHLLTEIIELTDTSVQGWKIKLLFIFANLCQFMCIWAQIYVLK